MGKIIKPVVYLWSSKERKRVVNVLAKLLEHDCEVKLWYKDVFPPGSFSWEAVEKALRAADFAILIVAGEDVTWSRKKKFKAPRDNLILEAGIALGVLGRKRAFLLCKISEKPKIPTDLSGLTHLEYAAAGPVGLKKAADVIKDSMRTIGSKDRLKNAEIFVPYRQRAETSGRFLDSAIHTVDTFAGDLSWLDDNLTTFSELSKRGVRVRFLTDTPNAPSIKDAQTYGIEFRNYATGDFPPASGSIIDWKEEMNSRALIVRKVAASYHMRTKRSPYQYQMVAYYGPRDHSAIKSMALLFEKLWDAGQTL